MPASKMDQGLGRRLSAAVVLVVEDDSAIREMVRDALSRSGYIVLTAASGEEAVRVANARTGLIHLLVTDFQLKKMHGLDVASALLRRRPYMKVLYMSGHPNSVAMRSLSASAESERFVLYKPFNMTKLLQMVHTLLNEKHA